MREDTEATLLAGTMLIMLALLGYCIYLSWRLTETATELEHVSGQYAALQDACRDKLMGYQYVRIRPK